MYKIEFIKQLAKKHRRPQRFYHDALNEILKGVQEQLAAGHTLHLPGFGIFYTRMRKASKGLNFKTKKEMQVKPRRLAQFRPGTLLKQAVRKKK